MLGLLKRPRFSALGSLGGLGWGVSTLLTDASAARRGFGLLAAVAGILVLVSYVLRFVPTALTSDRWSKTRLGRAMRRVLSYSWAVFLVVVVLAWLASVLFKF
ncbi:MAG: hypothetical protein ACLGH4_02620 [Actinomycetes bacterium]